MRAWPGIGILIWFCCRSAAAQVAQPAEAAPEVHFQAESRQVLVPVIVTDKKGHHVTGLKAADFQVLEDGVPQEISGFHTEAAGSVAAIESLADAGSRSDAGAALPAAPSAKGSAPPQRTYVICFDTLHSSFANFGHVREALEQLFKQDQSGGGAQYVLIALGRQLRVIQTATQDSAVLLSKMRANTFLSALSGADAQELAIEVNDVRVRMETFCRSCPCGPSAKSMACYPERQALRQEIEARSERSGQLTRGFLESLGSVIGELAKVPSSRTLILVSDGFSLLPGSEFFGVVGAYLPNYSEFKFSPNQQMEPLLQKALSAAVEKNVTIYSIDSRGVYSPSFAAGNASDASNSGVGSSAARNRGGSFLTELDRRASSVAFQNGSGMAQLAAATGGVYFHDTNDVLKGFRAAIADGREYYVVTYVPRNSAADGKFRRITVEPRDARLSVRAKEGYWAN
ncbi:MAG: VWA domain-containing protein [Acidobacteriota bacterium]